MNEKPAQGFRIALEWYNPHRTPPNGVYILAERFYITDEGGLPAPPEWRTLTTLGSGYAYTHTHISPPTKPLPPAALANIRRKRALRRIQKKYPLFQEEFLAEELDAKPNYYAGVTDPHIAAQRQAVLDVYQLTYTRLLTEGIRLTNTQRQQLWDAARVGGSL